MTTLFRWAAAYLAFGSAVWLVLLVAIDPPDLVVVLSAIVSGLLWSGVTAGTLVRATWHHRTAGRHHWVWPAFVSGLHLHAVLWSTPARDGYLPVVTSQPMLVIGFWVSTLVFAVAGLALDQSVSQYKQGAGRDDD